MKIEVRSRIAAVRAQVRARTADAARALVAGGATLALAAVLCPGEIPSAIWRAVLELEACGRVDRERRAARAN